MGGSGNPGFSPAVGDVKPVLLHAVGDFKLFCSLL